jgi:hypothetical protein
VIYNIPASLGTELQQPWPYLAMWFMSFSSSSGDQSPLLSFFLWQHDCFAMPGAGIAWRQQQAKTPAGRWPRARADRSLTMIARYMEGERCDGGRLLGAELKRGQEKEKEKER